MLASPASPAYRNTTMQKKVRLFTMRVSDHWIAALKTICRRKARTVTSHLERAVELASLVDEYCDGNDDPAYVRRKLWGSRKAPKGMTVTRLYR